MKFIKYILLFIIFTTTLIANSLTPQKVSLQLQWKYQFQFAGFIMAKEKGFYKDFDLDVDIKEWKNNINMVDEVINNNFTYSVARPTLLIDIANGKKISLLATIFQSSPLALVTTKESGIKSIKDFKNKRMMSTADLNTDASLLSMIFSQGVDIKNLIIQEPSFNVQDLIDGKTDLIASYISNEPFLLKELGATPIIFSPKGFGFNYYNDILITSQKNLKENPKQVEQFRDASLKGWEYAFSNIEETIEVILKKYNSQNKSKEALRYEAKELKKLAYFETKKIGKIEKHKLEKIYSVYKLLGLVQKDINFDNLILDQIDTNLNLTKKEKQYLKTHKVIKMCNNPNWEPIEFLNDGNINGIAIDTLKEIEKKLNIKFQNIPTKSWSQSQQFLKEKKCDILPAAIKTTKREKYANFTKPYLKLPLAIFTTKDKSIVSSLDQIMDKSWTKQKDSGLIAKLKEDYPNMTVIETKGDKEALQYVNSGKVYFTIATLPVATNVISKYMLNDLHIAGYTGIVYNLSIAVRNDDLDLLNILNKILNNITKDESKQIMRKWVTQPVTESIVDYKLLIEILIIVFIVIIFFIYKQYMLNKSVKEASELINATIEAIIIHKNGICVDANQSALDMFGYKSKEEFNGKNIIQQVAPQSQEKVIQNMTLENTKLYEATLLKKDGTEFYGLIQGKFIRDKNLRLASIIDITLLKEQEQLIAEQSKMVQMGEMIGNIAHQWRQPLSIISTATSGMDLENEMQTLNNEKFKKYTESIMRNTEFLSKTIDTFREYIKEKKELKEVVLQDRINSTINIIEASLKNNHIKLINNINVCEDIKINLIIGELSQAVINLINNAKDALIEKKNDKPELLIENRFIKINLEKIGNNAVITVEDNGGGIPEEIMTKIFDPYFTTKHQSRGTGLGLHMSKEIIEKHLNGKLTAKNTKNGAIFCIDLPLDKNL